MRWLRQRRHVCMGKVRAAVDAWQAVALAAMLAGRDSTVPLTRPWEAASDLLHIA